jgi:hypothetical protein
VPVDVPVGVPGLEWVWRAMRAGLAGLSLRVSGLGARGWLCGGYWAVLSGWVFGEGGVMWWSFGVVKRDVT